LRLLAPLPTVEWLIAPTLRWQNRLTAEKIIQQMCDQGVAQPYSMADFLACVHEHVTAYLHYALQFPHSPTSKAAVHRFFEYNVQKISQYFIEKKECYLSGVEGQTSWFVRDMYSFSLPELIGQI